MCSSTPEIDPMVGQAAYASAQTADKALEYYKAKDAAQAPRQAAMDALTTKLAEQQISSSQFNDAAARKQMDRYETVGVPAEDAMYADAAGYDTPAKRAAAAGLAGTDVDMSMAAAMDAKRRTQQRMGVNPADGRALSMEDDAATTGALAKAGAMNGARTKVSDMGIMLRKDAANFAKGMSSNAAQTFGTATATGNSGAGAIGAAIGSANQTAQTNGAGFGTAIQGYGTAGSTLNTSFANQSAAAASSNKGMLDGIGGIASMAMMFSDENMKEDVAPIDDKAALDGISKTNVKSWKYKPGSPADDGGQPHVGAMAQDMQKHLGDTVAPGGKMVDLISAIGTSMAATKALNKKVDRLASMTTKGKHA